MQIVRRLWTEENVTYRGEHFSVTDSTVVPRRPSAATAGTRGSTSAAPPRPPSRWPPPRPTSSCSGASRSTASPSGSSGSRRSSEELGREHAAAGVRAADHHAGARHHRAGLGRRRGEGRRDGRAGRTPAAHDPHRRAAVGQQRLLDLAARGEVLDDNLYTAPGQVRRRRRGHHLAGRLGRGRGRRRCASTRSWASPTSCSPTPPTCRRRPGWETR